MTQAASIQKFTCTANGQDVILVAGGYYKLLSSTGNVQITRENGSVLGPLLPGQGEAEKFNRLTIKDTSGFANTGYILIADDSFVDTRVYGEVSIDGGKARALAGLLYTAMPNASSLAANYAYTQLWNPAGTGKNLILMQASFASSVALTAVMGYGTVARATDVTATYAKSKKQGAAIGVAQIRWENSVAGLAAPFWSAKAVANQSFGWNPSGPLVIPPGAGVDVYNATLATDLYSTWEWYEEPV